MPNTRTLALALVSLTACGAPSNAGPSPTAGGRPAPFTAPQPPAHAAATTGDQDGAPAIESAGDAVHDTEMLLVDRSPRTSDLGAAVAASSPAAIARLGSPARIHVQVEGVDAPMPGQAVVVFLGVEFGGTTPAPARRVAVPTQWDGGVWVVGAPWDLPPLPAGAAGDLTAGTTLPADDPALLALAVHALETAGWDAVVINSLRIPIEGWAHPVAFEATNRTGDGGRHRHVVWLRRHLGHFVVAGTRVATTPAPATSQEQDPA